MFAMNDLKGRVAVVTGSTSGIGLAFARAVALCGGDVMLNGLGDAEAIETTRADLAAETGVHVLYHPADMTQPDQIEDMIATAQRELGRLDILVNNAGIQHVEAVENFPADAWEKIIAINLSSTFYATKAAIPIMKAQGRGRIINVASAHGLVASPFKSAYVAAKHGVIGFTKTVALELAQENITCNAICPGFVETPIVTKQIQDQARTRNMSEEDVMKNVILGSQPTKRFVTTDELAGIFLYLASDLGASANGAHFSVDGGWTAQ
ncbi:D-beta-hydroxybutyrate dehydrogenase [Brevundimonas diminuta]|uniref:3-hydroxybutyrate dehydrogenase n=1 Tax=Brevundimonas diminuta TaxID=293 RepID=UPI000207EAD2|nr:3-hydroxybutyrate dehydrogenase [Brevundimonas diminuta]EGF94401.1 bdhA [Brevundimonas diminuta ATCC 11568]OWR17227.1 3-hydroxybutyrate dehydrogenase [Brevundimonas diminuta]WQE46840.1 3-hydroxybutyrate dehydrogenase [Brevundimonas diminuta]SPU47687.1 D-beta-hydroxybutyrate dehydrogenase [Brevundimonas diminuta]SUW16098.1 D-beta-hydroxybutyrate dehydrogenase [Brevundimonas diminuta]